MGFSYEKNRAPRNGEKNSQKGGQKRPHKKTPCKRGLLWEYTLAQVYSQYKIINLGIYLEIVKSK